ncbi:uroporphyrinogen-III synthase [Sphaerotilus natans]|uniref:uroporphyrinogen-III synthase n=1 Tax=Sphaerotilus natans TaxID=34103 RepID=UPI00406C78A7
MRPAAAPLPCVLVTRPQPQADEWVARLQALGAPAQALPLMRIVRREGFDAAVRAAWADLARHRLVMFVSPNAVLAFFAGRPEGAVWPADTLAGATGPGTIAALRAQGVEARSIAAPPEDAASFDAESLWRHALAGLDWAEQQVLIVRGEDGRDWLAATLRQAGAGVDCLAAYARAEPAWTAAERAALAAVGRDPAAQVWLFSSSQCIDHLMAAPVEPALRAALRAVPVLATHPRIAETARAAGFAVVMPVRPHPLEVRQALDASPEPRA